VSSELLANSERKTRSRFPVVVVVNISLFIEQFCDPLAERVMIIKSSFPEEPAARGPSLVRGPPNMCNTKIYRVVFHTLFLFTNFIYLLYICVTNFIYLLYFCLQTEIFCEI